MKKLSRILIVGLFFISCKKEYQPRNIESVSIQEFKMDSTSIRAIHVISKSEVYFAGSRGDIGFTKDGGNSWTTEYIHYQDTISPPFRSIASNGTAIFALSIVNPALLYKITDDKNELVYKEAHKKVFYDTMKFFSDGKNGIAVGDPTEDCLSIITTSDGGITWTKIPCANLPKVADGEAFFAASNTNIAIVNNTVWLATGGKKSRIFKSTDKGKTWKVFNTPIIQGDGAQGIYSIDFYDKNSGIIIGGDYVKPKENTNNKAITNDGGKTWTIVANNKNPNYKSCVQYVPNTNGKEIFAVGKTGISFSNDGGKTWKDVSNDSYFSIQFVDKNTAWLSGHHKMGKLILE